VTAGCIRRTWSAFLILGGILLERRLSKQDWFRLTRLVHAAVVAFMTAGGWADTFDHHSM
jgi:hypothetical protein